jgi:hypothetical protein
MNMPKQTSTTAARDEETLSRLGWLQDAPMFIDIGGVERLYESVVRPTANEKSRTITKEQQSQLAAKMHTDAKAKFGLGHLWSLIGLGSAEAEVGAGGEVGTEHLTANAQAIELEPIKTPERQLAQITGVYLAAHFDRLTIPRRQSDLAAIPYSDLARSPRRLAFLDLPSLSNPGTDLPLIILPTAAEFEGGKVHLLYLDLVSRMGKRKPPRYPEMERDAEKRRELEKQYWQFFATEFSETDAIEVIEEASSKLGRIRWINYRLPLDASGSTLHLHVSGAGEYDTGTFAYHFIRRGFKHGLRLVGTLKSEPAMHVLAIYDK